MLILCPFFWIMRRRTDMLLEIEMLYWKFDHINQKITSVCDCDAIEPISDVIGFPKPTSPWKFPIGRAFVFSNRARELCSERRTADTDLTFRVRPPLCSFKSFKTDRNYLWFITARTGITGPQSEAMNAVPYSLIQKIEAKSVHSSLNFVSNYVV